MRTVSSLLHQKPAIALLALAVALGGWQCPTHAQGFMPDAGGKTQQKPSGQVVWHHVGKGFREPNHRPVRLCRIPGSHRPNRRLFSMCRPARVPRISLSAPAWRSLHRCPTITMSLWLLGQLVHSASITAALPALTGATRPASRAEN